MRERIYRTEALILRRSDFGEADRLLTLATPAGKRRVIARGVRKTMSRIAGHIELFTHTRLLLAIGRNLDVLTQSQGIQAFATLRADLRRLSCAYYVAELYDRLTCEGDESPALFRLLLDTFSALDTSGNTDLVLRMFELRLLGTIGYRPRLHRCAICQELLSEQAERYSPTLGGVLCPHDSPGDPHALPMRFTTFKLLRYLQQHPFNAVEHLQISSAVRAEAEQLLRASLRYILERDLHSVAFLEAQREPDSLLVPNDG